MRLEQEIIFAPISALVVSSPEEMQEKLANLKRERKLNYRYLALAVNNDKVIARLFHYHKISRNDIENLLLAEASDLLSLPVESIELDYHIFHSGKENIEGIFLCAPKRLVQDYLAMLDKESILPVSMTSSLLACLEYFLMTVSRHAGKCCLVAFPHPGIIQFVVLKDSKCQYLRRIKYNQVDEIPRAVVQSMQSACASSDVKDYDVVYIIGECKQKDLLVSTIKDKFSVEIREASFVPSSGLRSWDRFTNLNLFKRHVFSLWTRNMALIATYVVVLFLLMQSVFLAIELRGKTISLNIAKLMYQEWKYDYAVDLINKLKK